MSRGKLEALLSRIQPSTILSADERIFFSVLRDYKLDPELDVIRPEAPEIVAEMMDAPERMRRAQIRAAIIGLAAIAAMLQPWIWMLLTTAGQAADRALVQVGSVFPTFVHNPTVIHAGAAFCLVLAMAQWLVNVTRHKPIVFGPLFAMAKGITVRNLVWDPRPSRFAACCLP